MAKKIGLTQRVESLSDRAERRDCLDQAWTILLSGLGYVPVPLPNLVRDVASIVSNSRLDGVILTGGNDLSHLEGATNVAPERDRLERELLSLAAEIQLPLLGVCRGFQMMVVHYGGELFRIGGHVACSHGIAVKEPNPGVLCDRDEVNSFHDFAVKPDAVGPELTILATATDGSVEAVKHGRYPQWGIMWHPERAPNDPRDGELISRIFG